MKNILFITSDQQHWLAMGYDNPEVHTPNLDRLAARGTIFQRAYCPNPTCTPTRASILTGQYPSQHGAYALGTGLDPARPTVNDAFHAGGLRTALVGKAHFQPLAATEKFPSLESYPILQNLDFWKNYRGPFFGFDDFELARNHADEGHVGQHYALWMESKGFTNWRDCFQPPGGTHEKQYGRWNIPEEFHYNTWISERTNALLEKYASTKTPFFLWSSYFDPHPPYLVPTPWDTMYDPTKLTLPLAPEGEHDHNPPFHRFAAAASGEPAQFGISGRWIHGLLHHGKPEAQLRQDLALYYGMISCMDHHIGRTLDQLDALGLTEETLIVFTSDHGHFTGQHGLTAKGPFHYEEGIRVPFLVSAPGQVPVGGRSEALQSLVDLAPTFLSAVGLTIPRQMTGLDQWAVWRGEKAGLRDHCLVENTMEPGSAELRTYINDRYKITIYRAFDEGELYDLETDPGEFRNLFHDPKFLSLKAHLLQRFLQAEMARDVRPMPRVSMA